METRRVDDDDARRASEEMPLRMIQLLSLQEGQPLSSFEEEEEEEYQYGEANDDESSDQEEEQQQQQQHRVEGHEETEEEDDHLIKRSKRTLPSVSPSPEPAFNLIAEQDPLPTLPQASPTGEDLVEEVEASFPSSTTTTTTTTPNEQWVPSVSPHSDLNLYYTCYAILGQRMWGLSSYQKMMESVFEVLANVEQRCPRRTINYLLPLSTFPQIQPGLFIAFKDLIRMLILDNTASETATLSPTTKERAVEALRNLSRCASNKMRIYVEFSDILVGLLSSDSESRNVKRFAIGTLNNVATFDVNACSLLVRPGLIRLVVQLCAQNDSLVIRERALWTLQSLAGADENGQLVLDATLEVIPTLSCLLIESGSLTALAKTEMREGAQTCEYVLEALRNLARASKTGDEIVKQSRELVSLVVHLSRHAPVLRLVSLATTCLDAFGVGKERRKAIQMIEIMCAVRCVPRVSRRANVFSESSRTNSFEEQLKPCLALRWMGIAGRVVLDVPLVAAVPQPPTVEGSNAQSFCFMFRLCGGVW